MAGNMEITTLQFASLRDLASFVDDINLVNYEVNRNAFQLSCTIDQQTIDLAIRQYSAKVLLQHVDC